VRFEVFALALSAFQNPRIDEVQRVAQAHHGLNVIPRRCANSAIPSLRMTTARTAVVLQQPIKCEVARLRVFQARTPEDARDWETGAGAARSRA